MILYELNLKYNEADMITRIVKMTFKKNKTDDFEKIFEESKEKIISSEGCLHLELLKYRKHSNVYFTISKWESEDMLDNYRTAKLFISTWSKTKMLFQI